MEGSLELAQIFLNIWFWHVHVYLFLIKLMILVSIDNLLQILTLTLENVTELLVLRDLGVCNVLHIWECLCHPYL